MWKKICKNISKEQGQSLVELALTLPILLLLFLGLIELGFALRAYLVMINANREAARFASRGVYTDEQIATRALIAFSGQLPVRTTGPNPNTGIIITRFHIPSESGLEATYDTPVYTTGTLTNSTRISPAQYLVVLQQQHDEFNQDLIGTHPEAARASHEVVFVEIYYYHSQALHAPIVEWVFPDPLVLYSKTMIRLGLARAY